MRIRTKRHEIMISPGMVLENLFFLKRLLIIHFYQMTVISWPSFMTQRPERRSMLYLFALGLSLCIRTHDTCFFKRFLMPFWVIEPDSPKNENTLSQKKGQGICGIRMTSTIAVLERSWAIPYRVLTRDISRGTPTILHHRAPEMLKGKKIQPIAK